MMMIAPSTRDMYASNDTIPANQPFSLYRLSNIRPIAKIKKNIPAKEIYILSMDIDISFTSQPLVLCKRIITYSKTFLE